MKYLLLLLLALFGSAFCYSQKPLNVDPARSKLRYAAEMDASLLAAQGAEEPVVLMSVFKTHLAAAVLAKMQANATPLSTRIAIPAQHWELDTWSPLRKLYRGRAVTLTLQELMEASLELSDNITTDILIDYLGGMEELQRVVDGWKIGFCRLEVNEEQMQHEPDSCYRNVSTPRAVIELLRQIKEGDIVTGRYQQFLVSSMQGCQTGSDRLKAGLPQGLRFAHKTGGTGRDAAGLKLADNDVGFLLLPDGRVLYIAAFIEQSALSDAEHAALMEGLASRLYQMVD